VKAKRQRSAKGKQGFSLVEMVTVVAVLGILAGIGIASYNNLLRRSKETGAKERAEWLNQALQTYIQVNGDFTQSSSGSAADEMIVLRTLQWGDPSRPPSPGQPYVTLRYNPVSSSDTNTYRLQWTGYAYKVLKKNEGGTGILIPFDGSDMTNPPPIPATFRPAGR
jgi:prepilin-type N-terminal cleavage/methylation domain-containing protein